MIVTLDVTASLIFKGGLLTERVTCFNRPPTEKEALQYGQQWQYMIVASFFGVPRGKKCIGMRFYRDGKFWRDSDETDETGCFPLKTNGEEVIVTTPWRIV